MTTLEFLQRKRSLPVAVFRSGPRAGPVRRNRPSRHRAKPETAEFIESQKPAREAMNRAFAMNLATIRKATELTQKEIAAAMVRDQSSVSKMETRSDMLLSTLAEYLLAAGVDAATITVTVKGVDYSFDLGHGELGTREAQDA